MYINGLIWQSFSAAPCELSLDGGPVACYSRALAALAALARNTRLTTIAFCCNIDALRLYAYLMFRMTPAVVIHYVHTLNTYIYNTYIIHIHLYDILDR